MRTNVRGLAVTAAAAMLLAGCAAAAAPTPTAPTATAAPAAVPTSAPTATPALTAAPVAPASPAASVGPMDAAYVTCTTTITELRGGGTESTKGDLSYIEGEVIVISGTCSDARVSGRLLVTLNGVADARGIGFESGTMRLENAGGAWEGTFRGGVWSGTNASDSAAWLVGSGAYEGLTFYQHTRSAGMGAEVVGVILPAPPPVAAP